jgi:hypothetical protein
MKFPIFGLLFLPTAFSAAECVLTCKHCENFPLFSNKQFPDKYGEELLGIQNSAACLRRAEDFHHWCGNGRDNDTASVAATYTPSMYSQVYHPTACDPEWSFYNGFCYIHVWRAKTWWESETWCNTKGGNLCSIHGKQENEFVFTLTKGLSSWIGYHDTEQEEEHKWSDDSKTDYENRSKNCTGRETEADCSPAAKAQQWYDWNGADRGTWVCKKPARWAAKVMRNTTTLVELPLLDWEVLKVEITQEKLPPSAAAEELAPVAPKRQKTRVKLKRRVAHCADDESCV